MKSHEIPTDPNIQIRIDPINSHLLSLCDCKGRDWKVGWNVTIGNADDVFTRVTPEQDGRWFMLFALLEHFPTTSANRIHDNASIFAEMVRMLGQDSNLLNHQRLAKDISTVANSWCILFQWVPCASVAFTLLSLQVDPSWSKNMFFFLIWYHSISQLPGGSSLRGGGPIHSCIGPPARCVWIEGCCLQLELPTGEGLETSINKQFWKLRISEPPKFQDISFIFFPRFSLAFPLALVEFLRQMRATPELRPTWHRARQAASHGAQLRLDFFSGFENRVSVGYSWIFQI